MSGNAAVWLCLNVPERQRTFTVQLSKIVHVAKQHGFAIMISAMHASPVSLPDGRVRQLILRDEAKYWAEMKHVIQLPVINEW